MRKPPLKRFSSLYTGRKEILTQDENLRLFSNEFIVEEKLDGTLTVRKYGDVYLMLEDMRYVHSVFYDRLPSRYILVDVCKEDGTRLPLEHRRRYSLSTGYPLPQTIVHGWPMSYVNDFLELLFPLKTSRFGSEQIEGFVIKSQVFMDLGGKYSRLDLAGVQRYDRSRRNEIVG